MARRPGGHDELRRAVARLDRLDSAVVRGADGPVLLDVAAVRDPVALLSACLKGQLHLAALRAGLELRREPRPLHPTLLARAHRDLRALALSPEHRALILDAPRSLRRAVGRGADWLAERHARLEALRLALEPADPLAALARHADNSGPDLAALAARSPWLATALELAAAAHGDANARAALDLLRRSMSRGTGPHRDARRRADALLRRLSRPGSGLRRSALDIALDEIARDALAPAPPRQRDRKLRHAVLAAIAWPSAPPAGDPAPAIALPVAPAGPGLSDLSYTPDAATLAALRRYADAAIAAVHAPLDRAALLDLDRAVAFAALAFRIDPDTPAWGPGELADARRLDRLYPELAPGLRLDDALWLARTDLAHHRRTVLAGWFAAGLLPADVDAVIAAGRLDELLCTGDVDAARRFCFWVTRLVPHYRQLGVDLRLEARQFAAMTAGRRGEIALLAHCLLQHEPRPRPAAVQREIALLDATLGLFRGVPQAARDLLARLDAVPAGRGRALHPEFAAWLGAHDLLDRYCHFRELLGEPAALSNNLRSDFEAAAKLTRQIDHLRALPDPTDAQRQLLARLEDKLARDGAPPPDWTRRRLAEQLDDLRARAFRHQLDAALRELLRVAFAVDVPALTPTWRDVVRFYLGGDWTRHGAARNRELLGELLRAAAAAPGAPVTRTWPKNQAWIDAARAHLDVDAWLRPRRHPCRIGARDCALVVEDDPLEVLRMGVPFDTCLSLRGGFNAASAVLNAVDVNKRVLYLRAGDGTILARQLIAVGADYKLLQYRLYDAVSGPDRRAVEGLFEHVIQTIAEETGMSMTGDDAPLALHGGFWYDDGALPAPERDDEVARVLAERDLPVPPRLERWQRRHLHALAALRRRDPVAAIEHVGDHDDPLRRELAHLAVTGLGEPAVRARARTSHAAALALVVHALTPREPARDPAARLVAALALATGLPPSRQVAAALTDADARLAPSARLAHAWLDAAERMLARGDDDDDGIAHHAFHLAPHLACLPLAELLSLADRLEAHWDAFVAIAGYCAQCRDAAAHKLTLAAEAAFRRAPAPGPILRLLTTGRPGLALRLALHLAARYPLTQPVLKNISLITCSEDNIHTGTAAAALVRLNRPPVPCPAAARALQSLARRHPQLATSDDFIAAAIRHGDPRTPLELPRPDTSPLVTCAELVLHAPGALAHYAEPRVLPAAWHPDRWELALHRRILTRWRHKLARAAAGGDTRAAAWLHTLGLDRDDDPPAARAAHALTRALVRGEAPDLAEFLRLHARAAPDAIDPAATILAWRTFRGALTGDLPVVRGRLATELLLAADNDSALPLVLLDALLTSPRLPDLESLVVLTLAAIAPPRLLSGRQIVGLWALPGARERLVTILHNAHRYQFTATIREIVRAGGPAVLHAILTAWFARQAADDAWCDDLTGDPDTRPIVLAAAAACAIGFMRVFDDAPILVQLECIDFFRTLPPATRAAIHDLVRAIPETDRTPGQFWLLHASASA